jgi:predicted Zn-dependent protease with MMP-like domain
VGERDELERRLAEAEEAFEEEDFERIVLLLERPARRPGAPPRLRALLGLALYYLGEGEVAAPHLDATLAITPEDPETELARALLHHEALETERAAELLRALARREPEFADAHYWLGRVLEWWAEERPELAAEAEASLERAARLAPDDFPLASALSEPEFRKVLEEALRRLPDGVARAAEEVAVLVERYPPRALLAEAGASLAPDLLGLYTGTPLPERSSADSGRPPDVIHLFRRNLEFACRDAEELREEIRVTLLHEVGHYLGMDEPDLERLGLE